MDELASAHSAPVTVSPYRGRMIAETRPGKRDLRREKREGVSAVRGVLIGLALSVVMWAAIIALFVWLI